MKLMSKNSDYEIQDENRFAVRKHGLKSVFDKKRFMDFSILMHTFNLVLIWKVNDNLGILRLVL